MDILLWLVFPVSVTLLAMVWAAWRGRPRRREPDKDSPAVKDRFAAAVQKPHPTAGRGVGPGRVDRSTGVAVRGPRSGSGRLRSTTR